jgi:hypothetical protein
MFRQRGSNQVHNIITKSREIVTIKYVVNVVNGVLSRFYIFKGERSQDGPTLQLTNQGHAWPCKRKLW